MSSDEGFRGLGDALDAAEDASPVEAVESVTQSLGTALGATSVSFLISDLSGRALVRLSHVPLGVAAAVPGRLARGERRNAEESATVLPFDGGPHEQAVRTQTVQVLRPVEPGDGAAGDENSGLWRVIAPVTERGEAIGLLELMLPTSPDTATVDEIARAAHLLAFVVIANRRHTDLFEWGRRSREFSLSAEIQQRLLPGSYTCEAGSFTLSAWLEPAASVGGDTFDYSLARDELQLSLTDAMGHGVSSALTASLCVGSLRGSRRLGLPLVEQARIADEALRAHATEIVHEGFVTGLLGRLDLRTGLLELVNAGHVAPFLARDGAVRTIDLPPALPLGLFPDTVYVGSTLELLPRDRVVFVTDGMLERDAAALDLPAMIRETASLHARETVRWLADRVLDLTGHALSDDATLLVLDWHGDHGRERNSVAGADS